MIDKQDVSWQKIGTDKKMKVSRRYVGTKKESADSNGKI